MNSPLRGVENCDMPSFDSISAWVDAVVLLSMDAVAVFQVDIGIAHFYNDCVREAARQVQGCLCVGYDEWFGHLIESLPRQFLELVECECGIDIAKAVDLWISEEVTPINAHWELLSSWEDALIRLRKEWKKHGLCSGHPLDAPEDAHLRLLVRKYINQIDALREEVLLMDDIQVSAWDKSLNELDEESPEFCTDRITFALRWHCSRSFWKGFAGMLSHKQRESLSSWASATEESPMRQEKLHRIPCL